MTVKPNRSKRNGNLLAFVEYFKTAAADDRYVPIVEKIGTISMHSKYPKCRCGILGCQVYIAGLIRRLIRRISLKPF
jgi:hypothetical protein